MYFFRSNLTSTCQSDQTDIEPHSVPLRSNIARTDTNNQTHTGTSGTFKFLNIFWFTLKLSNESIHLNSYKYC